MKKTAVLIFCKAPIPGFVKTRLARTIGDADAFRVYDQLVRKTALIVSTLNEQEFEPILYSTGAPFEYFERWVGFNGSQLEQPEGDLGDRLNFGFAQSIQSHDGVLAIGTDCPSITEDTLIQARQAIEQNDVVIGPTPDGGYYLIGLKQCPENLFSNIEWSSGKERDQTIQKAKDAGLTIKVLPELTDVDEESDLSPELFQTLNSEFAVIIPTLNEKELLPKCLESLRPFKDAGDDIVVADGGSTDGTCKEAFSFGIRTFPCSGGRGGQIAAALKTVSAENIAVVHADVVVPVNAREAVKKSLEDPGLVGGALGMKVDSDATAARLIEAGSNLRARLGLSYGDQVQFFRRSKLDNAGGFPEQPLFEDVELALRLNETGKVKYLNLPVSVSDRSFQKLGFAKSAVRNQKMLGEYLTERSKGNNVAVSKKLYKQYYEVD